MENRLLWMDDESVKHISQRKLEFLQELYNESKGKSQKELVAYIMPMMKKAKKESDDSKSKARSSRSGAKQKTSKPKAQKQQSSSGDAPVRSVRRTK